MKIMKFVKVIASDDENEGIIVRNKSNCIENVKIL